VVCRARVFHSPERLLGRGIILPITKKASRIVSAIPSGEVEKELTGRETEPWEIIYFKLYKSHL
jgi:hypothetical protein